VRPPEWQQLQVLVLGGEPDAVEAIVTLLEAWGMSPHVVFDVPAALDALAWRRPELVIIDDGFAPEIRAELLSCLRKGEVGPKRRAPYLPFASAPSAVPVVFVDGAMGVIGVSAAAGGIAARGVGSVQLPASNALPATAFAPLLPALRAAARRSSRATQSRRRRAWAAAGLAVLCMTGALAVGAGLSLRTDPATAHTWAPVTEPATVAETLAIADVAIELARTGSNAHGPTSQMPYCAAVERWRPSVREALRTVQSDIGRDGALAVSGIGAFATSVDEDLVLALIQRESTGDPHAVSPAGAVGLMQVLPRTFVAVMPRLDRPTPAAIRDSELNLHAGIRYLLLAERVNGGMFWALTSYKAGIETVSLWQSRSPLRDPIHDAVLDGAAHALSVLDIYGRHRPDRRYTVPSDAPLRVFSPLWQPDAGTC
jgi:soluble lytic murein transglycosylase-like protein/CheY-like chemotaxis protein